MRGFITEVADALYRRYGDDISSLRLVFPNRRAQLFFCDALSSLIHRPLWQPAFVSIGELMERLPARQRPGQADYRTLQGLFPCSRREFRYLLFLGGYAVGRFRPDRQIPDRCGYAVLEHRRFESARRRSFVSDGRSDPGDSAVLAKFRLREFLFRRTTALPDDLGVAGRYLPPVPRVAFGAGIGL